MNDLIIDIPSNTGGFVVRETIRCAFFVRRPHLNAAADVYRCIEKLINLFPPPALSTFSIESGDWLEFDAAGLRAEVHDRLVSSRTPNASVHISGNEANIPDCGIEYAGLAIDRPAFSQGTLALWFQVGASVFPPHRETVLRVSQEIIEILGCSASYIDLALEGDRSRMQAMARRFRNVDISHVRIVARDLANKLPGVFWRTYLGPDLTATMGGQKELTRLLGSSAEIHIVNDGLELTLGPEPTLGDINRSSLDAARISLARFAHGRGLLHVPRKVRYFHGTDELGPQDAQEQWHLRFVSADHH